MVLFLLWLVFTGASNAFVLSGTIKDGDGKPQEGAEVFAYDSPLIRRPADFISSKTAKDGRFSIKLPERQYWVVARVRGGDKFGPLMPGDKHSGEPVEVEPPHEGEARMDFTVTDIREAAQSRRKTREDYVRVSGRILTMKGTAATDAYVYALPHDQQAGVPPFISSWSNERGEYVLFLPPGSYRIGAAMEFPPDSRQLSDVVFSTGNEAHADVRLPHDPRSDAQGHPDEEPDE